MKKDAKQDFLQAEEMTEEDILSLLFEDPSMAIRILTKVYGGLIYSVVWRRLHGILTNEDMEECVSDVFIECYQSRENIDLSKGSLKSLLLTIAKRKGIKYYNRKVKQGETVELDEETESVFYDEHTPETKMLEKERSQKLLKEINALGEPNASIIKYKYYYGMTAKEIGKKVDLSKNAVEKRVKRCLSVLGQRLQL